MPRKAGWWAQEIYNAQGVLLVSTEAMGHRHDPRSGLWMPRTVKVNCPSAQFSMQLDLGNVEINVPPANPIETFTMPTFQNTPAVDIGNPNFRPPRIVGQVSNLSLTDWKSVLRAIYYLPAALHFASDGQNLT